MSDPNDLKLLNFFPELYVGTESLKAFDTVDPPLGFATPFGKDKAFEKRKETVDRWCGDGKQSVRVRNADGSWAEDSKGYGVWKYEIVGTTKPTVIPNTPLSGFTFDRSIERDRTSNKVFRITDPRGFQLEISAENLTDILLHCAINKGEIVGDFIWGRLGGTNFLTRMDHPSYLHHLAPAVSREIQPGDHVFLGNKPEELVYCGEFYIFKGMLDDGHTEYGNGPDWSHRVTCTLNAKYDSKTFKVFKKLEESYRPYVFLRNPSKVIINSEGNPLPADLPAKGQLCHLEYSCVSALFDTKEEMLAFSPTFDEMVSYFDHNSGNSQYKYTYLRGSGLK